MFDIFKKKKRQKTLRRFKVLTSYQRPYNVVLTSCAGWVIIHTTNINVPISSANSIRTLILSFPLYRCNRQSIFLSYTISDLCLYNSKISVSLETPENLQ